MAYCGNCGVNVGSGRFCPNCGTMCTPTAEKPVVRTKSSAAAENKRWKQAFFTMFIIAVIVLLSVFCASASKGLVGRWEAREGYWSSQRSLDGMVHFLSYPPTAVIRLPADIPSMGIR